MVSSIILSWKLAEIGLSKRIPAIYKAMLGEALGQWYQQFGKVAPRSAYHEDDEGSADAGSSGLLFEEHPLFSELPIGAPSDLTSVISNDQATIEAAEKRSDELTNELKNRLSLTLRQKKQHRFIYQDYLKPI